MAKEDREFRQGERIAGTSFVIIQRETAGGHGSLYRVRHHKLERRIFALKILHADLRSNTDLAVRMEQEAQILASMNHPNIVQIYDAGTTEEVDPDTGQSVARPFLAMEWLKGRSLAQILAGVHGVGIGLHDGLEIGIEVADALDYAHTRHGVIHRDIKPDNVFLQAASSARGKTVTRLLDFGVAAVLGVEAANKITQKPAFLGTPRYAAPEQLRGEAPTPQTDLYAFGLLLYEMLVGYGPYDELVGGTRGHNAFAAMARAHLSGDPAPLPDRDFPQAIVELVASCLAKRSTDRPRSALDISNRLREIKFKAEERRAQTLADLSRTDPTPVLTAIMLAGGEATDPGPPPGASGRSTPNLDVTSPGAPHALQAIDVSGDTPLASSLDAFGSMPHAIHTTEVDAVPAGARPPTTTARHNPQLLIDTAVPGNHSPIDRLAVTRTTPPLAIAPATPHGGHGTQSFVLPPPPLPAPPPSFIDGAPVRAMGDRYVVDLTAPRITPPPDDSATTTTTARNAVSLDLDAPSRSRSSFGSLLRLRVPLRYVSVVAATGITGLLLIVAIGSVRMRLATPHATMPSAQPTAEAPAVIVTPPPPSVTTSTAATPITPPSSAPPTPVSTAAAAPASTPTPSAAVPAAPPSPAPTTALPRPAIARPNASPPAPRSTTAPDLSEFKTTWQ